MKRGVSWRGVSQAGRSERIEYSVPGYVVSPDMRSRKLFWVILAFSVCANVILFFRLISKYSDDISMQGNGNQGRYLSEYDPYIADAKQRWSSKNQFDEDPFRNRTTSVITLEDRVCVSFEYSRPDVGGAPPFYCYGFKSGNLISKRDDVE